MRIGEALSLWLEDFDMAGLTITLHDRGENGEPGGDQDSIKPP
jgi:hypothetical protein